MTEQGFELRQSGFRIHAISHSTLSLLSYLSDMLAEVFLTSVFFLIPKGVWPWGWRGRKEVKPSKVEGVLTQSGWLSLSVSCLSFSSRRGTVPRPSRVSCIM